MHCVLWSLTKVLGRNTFNSFFSTSSPILYRHVSQYFCPGLNAVASSRRMIDRSKGKLLREALSKVLFFHEVDNGHTECVFSICGYRVEPRFECYLGQIHPDVAQKHQVKPFHFETMKHTHARGPLREGHVLPTHDFVKCCMQV